MFICYSLNHYFQYNMNENRLTENLKRTSFLAKNNLNIKNKILLKTWENRLKEK